MKIDTGGGGAAAGAAAASAACGGVAFAALFWLIQTSDHRKIEIELDVKLRSNWTYS